MQKKIFKDIEIIIETPHLSGVGYSDVGCAKVYLNEYGKIVVAVSNSEESTGYYAENIKSVVERLDDTALNYIAEIIQAEYNNRHK